MSDIFTLENVTDFSQQINIDELSNAMIDKLNNFICDRMKDNILEF